MCKGATTLKHIQLVMFVWLFTVCSIRVFHDYNPRLSVLHYHYQICSANATTKNIHVGDTNKWAPKESHAQKSFQDKTQL